MCLPYGYGSFEDKIPDNDPTVGVPGDKSKVLAEYLQCVNGGAVAAENVNGCRWGVEGGGRGSHWLSCGFEAVIVDGQCSVVIKVRTARMK